MGRGRRLRSAEDFNRALREGYGQGVGESYKPWLRVNDVSSHGRSSTIPGLTVSRTHHFLSGIEATFFYYADYASDVIDIREQFPLLPVALVEELATSFELPYPRCNKDGDLGVLSTDFLLTRVNDDGAESFEAYAVKPREMLAEKSIRERLELEQRWWEELGVGWSLVTEESVDHALRENLEWLSAPLRGVKNNRFREALEHVDTTDFCAAVDPGFHDFSLLTKSLANTFFDGRVEIAKFLFHQLAWNHEISFDMVTSQTRAGQIYISDEPTNHHAGKYCVHSG